MNVNLLHIIGSPVLAFARVPEVLHTFAWIGLLLMVGTLLGEYCVGGHRFYEPTEITPKVKKRRMIMWSLFSFFVLSLAIPAIL